MKNFILSIATITHLATAFAQNPPLTQQAAFGGTEDDYMGMFHVDDAKNFYFPGSSNSNTSSTKSEDSFGGNDVWILKTDNNFNKIWDKTIGSNGQDFSHSSIVKSDRIYSISFTDAAVSGNKTTSNFGGTDVWLICLDLDGNILWQQNYGGDANEVRGTMISYTDTSLLMISESISGVSGNKTTVNIGNYDLWLLEIGISSGQIIQQKSIGSSFKESNPNIFKSPYNQHFYITCMADGGADGDKTDAGYGGTDCWMLELDENLNVIKDKCFGGNNMEYSGALLFENDGFLLGIGSESPPSGNKTAESWQVGIFPNQDAWIVRLDLNWNVLWDKSYGGNVNDYLSGIFKNAQGNYMMSITSQSGISGNKTLPSFQTTPPQSHNTEDIWFLVINPSGNILHQEVYGGRQDEMGAIFPVPYSNTELILIASSFSGADGNKTVANLKPNNLGGYTTDLWVAKVDGTILNTQELNMDKTSISVYPNPFTKSVTFSLKELNENVLINFYSLEGKLIDSKEITAHSTHFQWETTEDVGVIFYEIQGQNSNFTGKLIKF